MNDYLNSIVFMGCKHCGKSTHGKTLAQKLNVNFYDTDIVLESIVGESFRDYYAKNGASAFLRAEEAACKKIITDNTDKQIVVATGGGICENAPALNELRHLGKFVFLELDIDFSVQRILSKIYQNELGTFINAPAYVLNAEPKNMGDVQNILMEKFKTRFEQYRNVADITIPLKNVSIEENFRIIEAALR